jgi:hypothetical protein
VRTSLRANFGGGVVPRVRLGVRFVAGLVTEVAVRARGLGYRVTKSGYYRFDFSRSGLPTIVAAARELHRYLDETHQQLIIAPEADHP